MHMKNICWILILSALAICGCTTFEKRIESGDPLLVLATGRAVDALIQKADDPKARAERVLRYTSIIKDAIDSDELTTFSELRDLLVAEIPTNKLLPGEYDLVVALVDDVISTVRQKAQDEFGDNIEGSKTTLVYFLDIAIRTARLHV